MSQGYDYEMICIGSGPAGQRAAVQAAKLRKRVAVIEKRARGGGASLATGTIPSKTFREAVFSFVPQPQKIESQDRRGSPQRPEIQRFVERVHAVLDREADVMYDQLCRNDVEILWGETYFQDPHTLVLETPDGATRTVTAEFIVITVGTVPAAPPGVVPGLGPVITSDQILKLERLPRTLAVIGGGVIGIEYASMFAALGVEVTLIDRRDRPLEFLDHEVVDELIHQMRSKAVIFRMGEGVDRLEVGEEPHPRALIQLESGKRIVADVALFAIGRQGATESLLLDKAGLTADERGRIEVDEQYRTCVPHIFAAGDVIGYPALAATSARQGRLAARHAFGLPSETMTEDLPIGIYSIPEISMYGRPEHELTADKVPYEVGLSRYREIARGQILGDDSGMFKMLFHRESRKLLGVHIIGTGATELLHIGQAVMRLGGGLDYFLETVFNYPTLAECYKVAAFDAANKLDL